MIPLLIIVCAALLIAILIQSQKKTATLERVEHRLDKISPPPKALANAPVSDHVKRLIMGGDIMGAIKQHRAETGMDLRSSKELIEDLAAHM